MSAEKSLLKAFLTALAVGFFTFWGASVPVRAEDLPRGEARFLFTGDVLLSRGVERRLAGDPEAFVRALRPILSGADFCAGNLEGAAGPAGSCRDNPLAAPCFPIREEFLALLRDAGFKAIGLANNHSGDLGPVRREATQELLAGAGLRPLTYENSPQFVRIADLVVAVVSFSMVPGRDGPGVRVPSVDLRQKLRLARNLANVVFVYVHWGSEFLDWPDRKQRRAAVWLVQNGADVIVGHHPHLIQKPECVRGKPVFYSLGNLVFDQKYPSTRLGLLADCRIRAGAVACSAYRTGTLPGSVLPVLAGGADEVSEKILRMCDCRISPPLVTAGITVRPENPKGDDGTGFQLEGERSGRVLWKTRHAKIVSLEPMVVEGERPLEYLLSLERHLSPIDGEEGLRPCVYEALPEGLVARWKGTALAWPLIDAAFLPGNKAILCAQHREDSFLMPRPGSGDRRFAAYRWKGFGFEGVRDAEVVESCREYLLSEE
ncbi:MAG: CapA family protein [Desulfobacteraceae bacterium]|nr:CapA family protein [Desulfobacteraceae bacterium]